MPSCTAAGLRAVCFGVEGVAFGLAGRTGEVVVALVTDVRPVLGFAPTTAINGLSVSGVSDIYVLLIDGSFKMREHRTKDTLCIVESRLNVVDACMVWQVVK